MTHSVTPSSRPLPVREDCWTQEASSTLIEAWGRRYLELNRGNLRQKDWQQVSDIVNARHGHSRKTYRTDVQCKNRIDTIKKKYKVEKARVSASAGMVTSSWTFYDRLDELIGSNLKKPATAAVSVSESLSHSPPMALPLPYSYRKSAPLATAVLPKKRPSPVNDSYFRRNYSAVAAAAAATTTTVDDDDDEDDDDDDNDDEDGDDVDEVEEEQDDDLAEEFRGEEGSKDGIRKLAKAIRKFGDVYEKVEAEKQNQMIEMEKQRMQLAKELEVQRMQMFVDMQLQLKKMKTAKGNKSSAESA